MAQVPATSYESTSLGDVAEFTIPFPFLSRAEVFVTVDGAPVAFTWINDGLVQLTEVPELGAVVRRYRSTAAYVPLHQFSQGVPFLPRYVDRDFKQTLYAVQESVNDTAGTSALALDTAELALDTAQDALTLVGERTQYMVLGPYGPGLHFQTTSQVFSYLGEFYAPGPSIVLPYTTTGIGAAEIANFRSVGDALLRQDLANSADPAKGASLVGYEPSSDYAAGSVGARINVIVRESERHIYHYLTKAEQIDSRTYNPQIDTTARLNDAFNDSSIKSLRMAGGFKVSGSGAACLTMTENISVRGENVRTTFIRADGAGANTSLLSLEIANNGGMGDVRGWEMDNIHMFQNGGGSHVIVNDAGLPMFNSTIRNCNLSAGVAAGARDLIATKMAFSVIEQNTFGSGVTWGLPGNQAADGSKFLYNMFFGTGTGLILDIEDGAYCTEIYGGTMVNRDGGIRILRGDQIRIRGVQFEHAQGQGASQSPEKAHIAILGTGQLCDHVLIEANNFGGGTNLDYLVWVDNATSVDITKNFMNAPAVADVYVSANSTYTKPRVDNIVHGSISNPRNTATRFPMVVVDNGYGTYNVTKAQTALVNGWVGGAFHKNEMDEIVIEAGFHAGTNAPGTLLCTLPDGFKPADFYTLVCATSSAPVIITTNPNGQLTLASVGSNASVASQVRFSARRG